MGTGCLRNKGESLRCHPPEFIHLVPSFRPVLLCMAITADRHEVGRIERDAWVVDVVGCQVHDVMHRVSGRVQSALEALLT